MENRENGHDGPKVEEVPGVGIAGYTQDDDPIALMGGGFSQDDALVSYRLEHEVNEEFRQYAQSDIDRLMGTFDAWLADLQATFSNRVGAKLVAYAVREILRVWEKAANNGADRFKESSPSTGVQQIPTLVGGESSLTSAAESRDDESDGVGEAADKSPAQQATADPTEQVRTEEREDSKVLSWAARASEVSLYGNQSPEEQSAGNLPEPTVRDMRPTPTLTAGSVRAP